VQLFLITYCADVGRNGSTGSNCRLAILREVYSAGRSSGRPYKVGLSALNRGSPTGADAGGERRLARAFLKVATMLKSMLFLARAFRSVKPFESTSLDWLSPAVRQQRERNPSRLNVARPLRNSTRLAPRRLRAFQGRRRIVTNLAASRMSTIFSARSSENPRWTSLSIWPARFIYKNEYICSFLLSKYYYGYKQEHIYASSLRTRTLKNQTIPDRETKGLAKSRTTKSLGGAPTIMNPSENPMDQSS